MLSEDGFNLQGDGKDGRGHEDPHQLHHQGAARQGWRIQVICTSLLDQTIMIKVSFIKCRCEARGILDLGVSLHIPFDDLYQNIFPLCLD